MKKLSIVFLFVAILVLGACGHKHVYEDNVVAPTCTKQGYTEHKCECGDTYKDSTVAALGHSYGEWTVVIEATETEEGLKERTCSVCQTKEEEVIAKVEHQHAYGEWVEVKAATETEEGLKERECACGEKEQEVIEKLEHVHVFGEWTVVLEATEEAEGLQERECACGVKEEEEIQRLPHTHKFGEWEVVEEATTEAAGLKERSCPCGESEYAKISKIIDREDPNAIYVGTDLDYDNLADALAVAQEGDVIFLYYGEHEGSATASVANVTIKGPNAGINAVTGTRVEEAVFKGVITITSAATNLTIDGISFTEGAKIAYEGTSPYVGFKFMNNKVYDTNQSAKEWDTSRYALPAFIQFTYGSSGTLTDVQILNNSFINVSEVNVLANRVINLTVDGNVFKDFDLDAIRIEGGYAYGDLKFTNNVFEQSEVGQGNNGIFFRAIAGPANTEAKVLIENNKFIKLGKDNGTVFTAAISAMTYQENYTSFTIENNIFDHCYDYLYLRNNGGDNTKWFCTVENNQFLGLPTNQYYGSYNGSDSETTNPHLTVFTTNYYEDNEGNVITDLSAYASYFKHMASYGTALTAKPAA